MEEFVEISLLYDFYGSFLTQKQKEAIDLYYNSNYSLAEIGEKMGITRQGVRDLLIRSKDQLHGYDEKLGLVTKYQKQQGLLRQGLSGLEEALSRTQDEETKKLLTEVRVGLLRLMEDE